MKKFIALVALMLSIGLIFGQTSSTITNITNGKLTTDMNANGHRIVNTDTSGSGIQPLLIAGSGITITGGNVISATGGGGGGASDFSQLTGQLSLSQIPDSLITYPKIQNVTGNNIILGRFSGGAGPIQQITIGSGLSLDSVTGILTSTATGGGTGTVNTITGDNGSNTGLTLATGGTASDVTLTLGGTLSVAHGGIGSSTAAANTFFGNSTGSLAAPNFFSANTARSVLSINNVENTALSTWGGSTALTTVGTIISGVWNGTSITAPFLPALNSITQPTGDVALNNKKITNLADPTNALDGTNKQYVDSVANAGPPHPAAAVATTANVTLSGEQTIDGVTTSASRILVKNQTTGSDNGIYVTGAGGWSRAADANTGTSVSGSVFVTGGTVNAASTWGVTTPQPITLGTTSIAYTLTGQSTAYTAGNGLNLVGSQFSVSQMAANTIKGNNTGSPAAPIDLTGAQARAVAGAEAALGNPASNGFVLSSTTGGTRSWVAKENPLTFNSPLSRSVDTISIPTASGSISGALSSSDWTTFNSKESALTFSSPLSRSTNTISIPAATSLANGYLTSADWSTFNSKLSSSRLISTTSPLTGGGDLTADRTIAMPQSTGSVNGWLSSTDWTTFNNKTPSARSIATSAPLVGGGDFTANRTFSINQSGTSSDGYLSSIDWNTFNNKVSSTRTVGTTAPLTGGGNLSADRTITLPQATSTQDGYLNHNDFFNFSTKSSVSYLAGSGGTSTVPSPSIPVNLVLLNAALTSNLNLVLPTSLNYGASVSFEPIDIIDPSGTAMTTNNKTVTITAAGGDTIDGSTSIQMPQGSNYIRLIPNGINAWRSISYYTFGFKSPVDPTRSISVDVSNVPQNSGYVFRPATVGDSVSVAPTDVNAPGVIFNINADGSVIKGIPNVNDSLPNVFAVGIYGTALSGTQTITNTGAIDTVNIFGSVSGSTPLVLPQASLYPIGRKLYITDFSGTVGAGTPIVITANGTDKINGTLTTIPFDEANGIRIFTSDGTSNWSVSASKAVAAGPFKTLTASSGTFTLVPDPTLASSQKVRMVLGNGVNNLAIPFPFDGMEIEAELIQPASGAQGTLSLPVGSAVEAGGGGLITLSPTNGAIDKIKGVYDGTSAQFLWDAPKLNYTTSALPNAPSGLATGTVTSNSIPITWVDNSTNETGFDIHRSTDNFVASDTSVKVTGPNIQTFTDSNLSPGTTYYYKLRAQNTGGYSAYTSVVSAMTTAACVSNGDTNGTGTTAGVSIGSGKGTAFFAAQYTVGSGNGSVCRVGAGLNFIGTPSGTRHYTMYIYSDSGSDTPGTLVTNGTSTNSPTDQDVANNALGSVTNAKANPTQFTFSGVTLTVGQKYWIAIRTNPVDTTGTGHANWITGGTSSISSYKSEDATQDGIPDLWVSNGSLSKPYFITYH